MSTLKTNNLQTLDAGRTIEVSNIAEMNGGFSFRNKIVDGRFDFWYEGTSKNFSTGADTGFFTSTMWRIATVSTVGVHSRGVLTPSDLPEVPTAKFFSRTQINSYTSMPSSQSNIIHRIEDVATLAGKTVTLSWYARSLESKDISVELVQNFGNGTNASAEVSSIGLKRVTLTPTFQRFTSTFTLPSIINKTIVDGVILNHLRIIFWFSGGTSFMSRNSNLPEQTGTFDIACIQLEEGSIATPFEELPIEISQKRLERYFETTLPHPFTLTSTGALSIKQPLSGSTSLYGANLRFNTIKRVTPTVTFYPASISLTPGSITDVSNSALVTATPTGTSERGVTLIVLGTVSSTAGQAYWLHYVADARL